MNGNIRRMKIMSNWRVNADGLLREVMMYVLFHVDMYGAIRQK